MRYLHGCYPGGMIAHRDLKLENILLDADGVAKVADFGLFRIVDALRRETERQSSGLLKRQTSGLKGATEQRSRHAVGMPPQKRVELTGETGSYRYMAPEVFSHLPYNSKVDVFSFAIVAYEVLSRSRAYAHTHMSGATDEIAFAVAHSPRFRPRVPKRWHPDVAALLDSMWAADPAARPDFDQIVARLAMWHEAACAPVADAHMQDVIDSLTRRGAAGSDCACTIC